MSKETALAPTTGAPALDLSGFDPEKYNVLTPMLVHDSAAAHVRQRIIEVTLDSDPENGDCYKAQGGRMAPSKIGILKVASALGVVMAPHPFTGRIHSAALERCLAMAQATGRVVCEPDCPCKLDVAYRCTGAMRTPSGDWRAQSATYEWDSAAQRLKAPDDAQFKRIVAERHGLAETKAHLRLLRAMCGINHAYKPKVLARPFVVVRTDIAVDGDDPAMRQLMAERALASGTELFGSAPHQPSVTLQEIPQEPDWSRLAPDAAPPEPEPEDEEAEPDEAPPTDADGQSELPIGESDDGDPFAGETVQCKECGGTVENAALAYCQSDAGRKEHGGDVVCIACGKKARAAQAKPKKKTPKKGKAS